MSLNANHLKSTKLKLWESPTKGYYCLGCGMSSPSETTKCILLSGRTLTREGDYLNNNQVDMEHLLIEPFIFLVRLIRRCKYAASKLI